MAASERRCPENTAPKAERDGKPDEQQEMFWKKQALWVPDLHRT